MPNHPAETTIRVLEALGRATLCAADIIDYFSSGGFAYKTRKTKEAYREFHERSRDRGRYLGQTIDAMRERQTIYNLLGRLEAQGLIIRKEQGRKSVFSITRKGAEKYRGWKKLLTAIKKKGGFLPGAAVRYEKRPSRHPIVVSFDIPEKESSKRAWLRSALRNLDFKMLHQSTWIGDNSLPKEFVQEIGRLGMRRYVHIFSVMRGGTTHEDAK